MGISAKGGWTKLLAGRSARVVITMGMPALMYRLWYGAHGLKTLRRNILGFVGIAPVHETLVGQVGSLQPDDAKAWLGKLRRLGQEGE